MDVFCPAGHPSAVQIRVRSNLVSLHFIHASTWVGTALAANNAKNAKNANIWFLNNL